MWILSNYYDFEILSFKIKPKFTFYRRDDIAWGRLHNDGRSISIFIIMKKQAHLDENYIFQIEIEEKRKKVFIVKTIFMMRSELVSINWCFSKLFPVSGT